MNKNVIIFFFIETENRRAEQVLSCRMVPVGRGRCKERVQEGEYNGNIMYTCMKMEK
jgi:hypothetical protein